MTRKCSFLQYLTGTRAKGEEFQGKQYGPIRPCFSIRFLGLCHPFSKQIEKRFSSQYVVYLSIWLVIEFPLLGQRDMGFLLRWFWAFLQKCNLGTRWNHPCVSRLSLVTNTLYRRSVFIQENKALKIYTSVFSCWIQLLLPLLALLYYIYIFMLYIMD